jgi:hypothetical protein
LARTAVHGIQNPTTLKRQGASGLMMHCLCQQGTPGLETIHSDRDEFNRNTEMFRLDGGMKMLMRRTQRFN